MDTIIDLCFLCTKDYNCILADKKIVSQVEFLLPEITIIKLGVPLRICSDCDGALCAFSKFKQSSVESSRRLEARIKGAQDPPLPTGSPPDVDDSETSGAKPGIIEEIFIKEDYVEETPLDTNRAFLNPITLSETISAEPHNQLHKDRVSQNIQLHTDTNAVNTEEILIKEEQMEETSESRQLYSDILKTEYDVSNSVNDGTDKLPEHNTEDGSATLNTSEEVCKESSSDPVEEILDETDENYRRKKFIQSLKLNNHSNLLHNRFGNFPCPKCKKRFFHNYQLKRHIELHCKQTKRKSAAKIQIKDLISCSLCNKKFKNKTLLDWNIKSHGTIKDLLCKNCDKSFMQKDDNRSQSGVKDSENLVSQMSINSEINKNHCEICNKTFKYKVGLTKHMKIHFEVKDFQCEICGNSFKWKNSLNKHMITHSEVRDFQCKICHKTFKNRGGLTKHMKIHRGIKDFQCEICEKSFKLKYQLTSHMKIHSEIKDFQCVICEKSFTYKCSLINHMKHHSVME